MTFTANISPIQVRDYAKALGWRFVEQTLHEHLFILNHPNQEDYSQLILPIDHNVPDYADSLRIVVRHLADFQQVTPQVVQENILAANADQIRFRLYHSEGELDSVPFAVGVSSIHGIERLLLASIYSVFATRLYHHDLMLEDDICAKFINACHIGRTESTGFVWRISCPLNALSPLPAQDAIRDASDTSFTRRVTRDMVETLSQLRDGLVNDFEQVAKAARQEKNPNGANFHQGFLDLFDSNLNNYLEVTPTWSPCYPIVEAQAMLEPIRFEEEQVKRIERLKTLVRSQGKGKGKGKGKGIER